MKKLKFPAFISLIFTLIVSTATADDKPTTYTLKALYELAATHAEQIKIAEEEVFIAEKDKSIAFAVLVPRFTAVGSYTKDDLDQKNKPASLTAPADLDQKTDTTAWGVRLDQSFTLNGKELTALRMSKKSIERSNYDLNTTREETLFNVASAYYGVLQAEKAIEIRGASVQRMEKHKKETEVRLMLEDVTRTDLYRVESELSDAKSDYIDAQNTFQSARTILRTLVPVPDAFKLSEPDTMPTILSDTGLNELQHKGLKKRSIIKSTEMNYEISKDFVKIKNGDYWPTVALEGMYSNSDVTTEVSGIDTDADNELYSMGAKLTFTLFDGGLRRAEIKQANAKKRQARLALEGIKKEVKREVEETFLEVKSLKSKLNALTDKLKYSKQNYTAVAEQFKHGLTDSVDLMDANTLLVSAERELSAAGYEYRLSVLKLKKVTGTFLEDTGFKL